MFDAKSDSPDDFFFITKLSVRNSEELFFSYFKLTLIVHVHT